MSMLIERYTQRTQLGHPQPGPCERATDRRPPMVAILRGSVDQLDWFTDPAELRALEHAARVQRERLEQMLAEQQANEPQAAEQNGQGTQNGYLDPARPYIGVPIPQEPAPVAPAPAAATESEAPGPQVAARP